MSSRTGDCNPQARTADDYKCGPMLTRKPWAACLLLFVAAFGCRKQESANTTRTDGHARMLKVLAEIRSRSDEEHPYLGDAQLKQAEAVLANLSPQIQDISRLRALWSLAYHQARLGRLDESISTFNTAHAIFPRLRRQLEPADRELFLLHRAMASFRLGEVRNCLHCQNGDSCILPLRHGGLHSDSAGAEQAVAALGAVLEENPNNLTARWLLNIATMALDRYPENVPDNFRVHADKFSSQAPFPRFRNVARQLGLDAVNMCGGSVIDDFDNDGCLDILTSTWDTAEELALYRNLGNGLFERRTKDAGLDGLFGGLNLVQADYDNDGDLDALVLRGAWLGDAGRHPNSLLQNDGTGRFRDVTFESGLGDVHYPTQTAAWADYDNDGDLDLYIGNEAFPNQLFQNDGNGRFVDVAAAAWVACELFTKGVVWGDVDADGFPDLYVSNYGQENALYHNNRDGTFTDTAPVSGLTEPIQSFPVWFWDYNNDGALDLFVSSWWPDVKYVAAQFFDAPHDAEPARLYEGDGKGGFRDVAAERNLAYVSQPMGANFGDLDNDGWDDAYFATGYPEFEALMPNLMFRNNQGMRFEDVTMDGGFGHLQKGHAVSFGDLDNDGDQDIHVQMGGAFPGDRAPNLLFENPGFQHHWIGLKLVGRQSNRSAIGARICVRIVEQDKPRSIFRWVGSGGSFGANPLQQQIGLGRAQAIERIEILWPKTGRVQVLADVPIDRFLEVTEGVSGFHERDIKPLKFATQEKQGTLANNPRQASAAN